MKTWPERVKRYPWSILLLCYLLIIIISSSQAQGLNDLFLPVIFSPPPVLLPNGDFESDPIEWVLDPDGEQLIFSQPELPEGIIPHSGTHVGWLGDHGDQSQSHHNEIRQTVSLPGNDPVLRFWVWMKSGELCDMTKDQLRVYSNEELESSWSICKERSTNSWAEMIVELSGMQGDLITLRIQVETVNSTPYSPTSEVFLDDFFFATH